MGITHLDSVAVSNVVLSLAVMVGVSGVVFRGRDGL
jgi:hypothetical protein